MIWESKTWEEVLTIKNGKNQKKVVNPDGKYPIYGSGGVMGYADDYLCDEDTTIIGRKGSINNPIYVEEKFWNVDTAFGLMPGAELDNKFFYYYCTTYNFMKHNKATTLPSLTKADLLKIKIPLPPLDQQKTIAAILDAADTYRQKTKALVAKYDELTQSLFLDMFGDPVTNPKGWEVKTVYQVCAKIYGGGTPSKAHPEYYKGEIPWVTPKDMKSEYISNSMDHVNQDGVDNSSAKLIPVNSVLMVIRSGILNHTLPVAINTTVVTVNQDMKAYIPESSLTNSIYLKIILSSCFKLFTQ